MRIVILTLIAFLFATLSSRSAISQIVPGSTDLGAIWFVGDSITQSNADGDSSGSPRSELYSLLISNGYSFTYTGHHTANTEGLPVTGSTPSDNLFQYHSGISGSVIGDNISNRVGMTESLASHWVTGRLATVKPDVVLIMLGTNDVTQNIDIENASARLSNYIDQVSILADASGSSPTFFVASIPPNRRSTQQIQDIALINSEIPSIVSNQQSLGRDVHFVDQFTPLDDDYENLIRSDNLHTNAAGNASLATQWFNEIESVVGETAGAQTVYIGDAAAQGTNIAEGTNAYSLPVLTIVNLSDGNSAAPVIYTSPTDQDVQLTEVNFFTEATGNLTPFVVRINGADAQGSFDGQLADSYEVLAIGDVINAAAESLINESFTVDGANPTISLSAGDRIAAGFLTDTARFVTNDNSIPQGVNDYIFQGDSISGAAIGAGLTSASTFDRFDRPLSFNIGFENSSALLGDVNRDTVVNFLDISPFISVLSAGDSQAEADCNEDGDVSFLDIAPFISILSGQ